MSKVWVRSLGRPRIKRVGYTPDDALIDPNPDLLDLDDGVVRQTLSGTRNRWVVLQEINIPLTQPGAVAVANLISPLFIVAHKDFTVDKVIASVGVAPTGADDILIDVHKITAGGTPQDGGTTIFTDQGDRPAIAVTTFLSDPATGIPDPAVSDFEVGDILRVEVDQVGDTIAGANLSVQIIGH